MRIPETSKTKHGSFSLLTTTIKLEYGEERKDPAFMNTTFKPIAAA